MDGPKKDKQPVVRSIERSSIKRFKNRSNRLLGGWGSRKIMITVIASSGLFGLLFLGINVYKDMRYQNSIKEQKQINDTSKAETVSNYGKDQAKNSQDLQGAPSESWDKEKLDKAYFNLIYADKTGSSSDVYNMLFFIEVAQKSGLDIDNNSYGIDQQDRDQIRQRADEVTKKRTTKPKTNNE